MITMFNAMNVGNNFPEQAIEPPEDNRPIAFDCDICGEPIRGGDDYKTFTVDDNQQEIHICESCEKVSVWQTAEADDEREEDE